jgi:hypothetical protein
MDVWVELWNKLSQLTSLGIFLFMGMGLAFLFFVVTLWPRKSKKIETDIKPE